MNKLSRGIIGFVLGGGLAFLLFTVWLNSEGIGAEDVVQYLRFFLGLPVSLLGGVIGAGIGIAIGARTDDSSPHDSLEKRPPEDKLCPNCGCRTRPGFNTCKWCGVDLW